ncbi:MAG TPA: recombinase family protein [Thermomicrobiales bacterium]|jgi:site-specific DNA recombinase
MATQRISNALIYCRVSSDKQEENSSLGTQEAACRECCEQRGYAISGVYTEVYTASALHERPRLSLLRDAVRRGEVDVIVVYAIDRLSRDQAHLYILLDEAERYGARFEFVTEDFDSSPTGKMLLSLKGFAAEVEREKIIERTKRGLKARNDAGKLKPGATSLYGYRFPVEVIERDGETISTICRDRYEIDPQTAPIVRQVFTWYAEGIAVRAIATRLNAQSVPTQTGKGLWGRAVILRLLTHPSYKGEAYNNRRAIVTERGKKRQVLRPPEEWVRLPDGVIPPLVDEALFDACQDRAARNARESTRRNLDPESYLLRAGHVFCGHCGKGAAAVHHANTSGGSKRYYRVGRNTEAHIDCPTAMILAAELDAAAEAYLKRVVLDRDVLGLMIARLRDDDTTATDMAATEATLATVKKRQSVVAAAVAALDDADAAAPLLEKLTALAKERIGLEAQLAKLRTRADAASATLARFDALQEQANAIRENWHLLPYAAKRDLIAAIDLRTTIYPATAPERYSIESDANALLDAIASQSQTR